MAVFTVYFRALTNSRFFDCAAFLWAQDNT